MNLNYEETLRIFVTAGDLSGILVSYHRFHLSHPEDSKQATLSWKYLLVLRCFGFLIKILPVPVLTRRSGKTLDLSLMIDL